ncbi:MAG: nitrile hydratase subunit beta [Betaproteobacteria bacterium]
MNGVHDMGGLQCFGPVVPEPDEPAFHHAWERRALALTLALGATRQWNIDQARAMRESLPPAQYLGSTYYEIWIEGLQRLLLERKLITAAELADGRLHEPATTPLNALSAERVPSVLAAGSPTLRASPGSPRFDVGDTVRTRDINPPTHTRLPRYCRGKRGTVVLSHGAHVFPDTNARAQGESPQWLYTIRFDAVELWGGDTTASTVHVDCWEPYLDAVPA